MPRTLHNHRIVLLSLPFYCNGGADVGRACVSSGTDNMTAEALQKVADEALTQRKLVHPNIIAFREFFVSPTAFVSIMEYAPGTLLNY